jgi:hypothetical protein
MSSGPGASRCGTLGRRFIHSARLPPPSRHRSGFWRNDPEFYYPITQWPVNTSYYVVRTDGDPERLLGAIRRTIGVADRTIVRLALGATPGEVRRLVVGQGMRLCAAGAVLGVAAAVALGRLASNLLFGVAADDASTYALVLATVVVTGLVACWLPAVQASRVDPTIALRAE